MKEQQKIEVRLKAHFVDPKAVQLLRSMRDFLKINVEGLCIARVFAIRKALPPLQAYEMLFHDPVIETLDPVDSGDWTIEVRFKPGVTDNAGKIAQLTLEDFLEERFGQGESVSSATKYVLTGDLTRQDVQRIATELLANPLIQDIGISPDHGEFSAPAPSPEQLSEVTIIRIDVSDASLLQLSRERHLALNLEEMQAIQRYYKGAEEERASYGLPADPTDVELEVFAQTWSEHCKHKIFQAEIRYIENGIAETIPGLFATYIKKATEEIGEHIDWLVSVFTDNAGIVRFNEDYHVAFKVETHNSPSALDPYGGALTGILASIETSWEPGIGARIAANTNVLCFAPSNYSGRIRSGCSIRAVCRRGLPRH